MLLNINVVTFNSSCLTEVGIISALPVPPSTPVCSMSGDPVLRGNVTLSCKSSYGKPLPQYKWTKAAPVSEVYFSPMQSECIVSETGHLQFTIYFHRSTGTSLIRRHDSHPEEETVVICIRVEEEIACKYKSYLKQTAHCLFPCFLHTCSYIQQANSHRFLLFTALPEWRSCPQPMLVLGYLGKELDSSNRSIT